MMKLPTTEQLQSLPQWALCAFATRCARRVFPLYHIYVRRAPEHLVAIERALELSEQRTNSGESTELHDPYDLQALADTLGVICEAALNMEADAAEAANDDPFGLEARAYVSTAIAAQVAFEVTFSEELLYGVRGVDSCETIAAALTRISKAGAAPEDELVRGISDDFAAICQRVRAGGITDNDGVCQSVFGPLLSRGEPALMHA